MAQSVQSGTAICSAWPGIIFTLSLQQACHSISTTSTPYLQHFQSIQPAPRSFLQLNSAYFLTLHKRPTISGATAAHSGEPREHLGIPATAWAIIHVTPRRAPRVTLSGLAESLPRLPASKERLSSLLPCSFTSSSISSSLRCFTCS